MSQLLSGFQGNHAYIGNNSKQIICFSILNLIWIVISSITFRFSYAITLNLLGLVFRSRAFLKPEISRAYKSESLCLCRFPLYRSDKTGCNWYRQFLYLSGFPLCFSHFGSGGNFRFLFFSHYSHPLSIYVSVSVQYDLIIPLSLAIPCFRQVRIYFFWCCISFIKKPPS